MVTVHELVQLYKGEDKRLTTAVLRIMMMMVIYTVSAAHTHASSRHNKVARIIIHYQ